MSLGHCSGCDKYKKLYDNGYCGDCQAMAAGVKMGEALMNYLPFKAKLIIAGILIFGYVYYHNTSGKSPQTETRAPAETAQKSENVAPPAPIPSVAPMSVAVVKAPEEATRQQNTVVDSNGKARAENVEAYNKIKEKVKVVDEEYEAVCGNPEYAAFFLKSPCDGSTISVAQLMDRTKITQEQKDVILKWRADTDAINNELNSLIRSDGTQADKQFAAYKVSVQPEIDKYNLDFYNGVITLGEYNQSRKDLTAKFIAEKRRIYHP